MVECVAIPVGPLQTNCYLYGSTPNGALIIDPGANAQKIQQVIEDRHYTPCGILLTHEHPDHTGAVKKLAEKYPIPCYFSQLVTSSMRVADPHPLTEDDRISIGAVNSVEVGGSVELIELEIHLLPGHSNGGLIAVDYAHQCIFSGDSLFQGSVGRTDFGGSFSQLMTGIRDKIMQNTRIADDFRIYPGHGPQSTVGMERAHNPFSKHFLAI